ncbi:MAG: thiamine ABC transporter substrate-binding protein [bacterium]|nr:thiamine ABC transporter substrate-binding protein [bacterium]
MKKLLAVSMLTALFFGGCTFGRLDDDKKDSVNQSSEPTTITLYAYDSLTADYGLLPQMLTQFEEDNNAKVKVVSFDDTGTMLGQVIQEKDKPKADLVMGLDNVDYIQVSKNDIFTSYKSGLSEEIGDKLKFGNDNLMTPFDFGYIGFVYDTEAIEFPEAISLTDLSTDTYRDKVIIEQAGISSPGTQLLLWTNAALGDNDADIFWRGMARNVLTVAPDWTTAYYSMFLNDEAPIVLSYLTSPAYHIDQEQTERYAAVPIKEGYVRQIEGIGIVNGTEQKELAQNFVDYLLTDEVQNKIPTTQWMFPVLGNESEWPEAFNKIIVPEKKQILSIPEDELTANLDQWLKEWNQTFSIQ